MKFLVGPIIAFFIPFVFGIPRDWWQERKIRREEEQRASLKANLTD